MKKIHPELDVLTEDDAQVDVSTLSADKDFILLGVRMKWGSPSVPKKVRVAFRLPIRGILSSFTSGAGRERALKADWSAVKASSKLASGTPLLAFAGFSGENVYTIAVSDPKTPLEVTGGVSEEKADMKCGVNFFTSEVSPISSYEATIRIDLRNIPLFDAVKSASDWWENECGYPHARVPKAAREPMNSAWYSFHQQLDPDKIVRECEESVKYGMKTIILDDGWQTGDNNRGYAFCGDWECFAGKIPDMKDLVDRIHKTGMKVMLWYSVPSIGIHSRAFERFKDKMLSVRERPSGTVGVVDPRYPEVRAYLVGLYRNALLNWGLDGLKLDFIDSFRLEANSPAVNENMDIASVEDALDRLLSEAHEALSAINPDVLLEFRQSYVGPNVLKYGNMVRVGDCPYDYQRNRSGIVDLRMTSGRTAVHSDMLMWHENESVEGVALQLIGTLFGVPQISVLFDHVTEEQKKCLGFWLSFYSEHDSLLHDGKISVKNPEKCYSQVRSELGSEALTVNYENVPVEIGKEAVDLIVNASPDGFAVLTGDKCGTLHAVTYDCTGSAFGDISDEFHKIAKLPIPIGGYAKVTIS